MQMPQSFIFGSRFAWPWKFWLQKTIEVQGKWKQPAKNTQTPLINQFRYIHKAVFHGLADMQNWFNGAVNRIVGFSQKFNAKPKNHG